MEAAITTVGGAILSASFQVLFHKLGSHDVLKYACERDVLEELKKWERMLRKICLVLDDADQKRMANPSVNMWLRELRDLAYDVDDLLDEFATRQALRKLEHRPVPEASTSKMKNFMPTCCRKLNLTTFKFNAQMISKINEITGRLDTIMKERSELQLAEGGQSKSNRITERPPTTSLVNISEIHGRDEAKNAVTEILKAKACDGDLLSVIPIVGMGGLGKTTLAQLIFQNPPLEFDFKAWVSVGEDFDVHRITASILQPEGDNKIMDLNALQIKLKEKLSMKKFLIILDDIWTANYDLWCQLSLPFKEGLQGSTIIITTRHQHVASMMGTCPAYYLQKLSHEACLLVFAQHALGATNFNNHVDLKDVGEQIVKRCDGLPLAAKALGGILHGNLNPQVWMDVSRSEIWDFPDDKSNILPALRLSYFHLPSYLKQCFAYCAVFPKDYEFDKNELVSLWGAEGFLWDTQKKREIREIGNRYFEDLLARSFFQPSSVAESKYVMHDLMNDLARHVSSGICFQSGDKLEDEKSCAMILHSSFTRHQFEPWQKFDTFLKMRRLRTLLAMPIMTKKNAVGCYLTSKVLNELVPELKCLRVLSLAGYEIKDLPIHVGALKLLRYLNLSRTAIERLPESVVDLINLQTLILHGCERLAKLPIGIGNLIHLHCLDISDCTGLTELPSCIAKLINLHLLDLSGCIHLKRLPLGIKNLTNLQCLDVYDTLDLLEMPPHIGNLRNLETLTKFIVGKGNGLKLTELKKLSMLKGKLCIQGLQNVVDIRDAEFAEIKKKHDIQELQLEWAEGDLNDSRNPRNEMQVLNLLRPPHQNLSSLSIIGYGGSEFPAWIGDPAFTNMVNLILQDCGNITSLPSVGHFPSLETLKVVGMRNLEQWTCSSNNPNEAAVTFPKLRHLIIRDCLKLVGKLPSCFPSLQKLCIERCQEALLRSISDFRSLTTLEMKGISGLGSLDSAGIQDLEGLQYMKIESCGELMYLWKDETNIDKLASLKSLVIIKCKQIVSLVEGEEELLPCNLEVLEIIQCSNMEKLPNGLHQLAHLKIFKIDRCDRLKSLPATGVPYSLTHLQMNRCLLLESVPVEGIVNEMSQLEELTIWGCPSLNFPLNEQFPDSLQTFQIALCAGFKTLRLAFPNNLFRLTWLCIAGCRQLEYFPETELALPALTHLVISSCEKLRALPNGLHKLSSVRRLWLTYCRGVESFPEGGLPPNLNNFQIRDCDNFRQPIAEWDLLTLSSLTSLEIHKIPSTEMLDSLTDNDGQPLLPTSLITLEISDFMDLTSFSTALRNLTSLISLDISNCPKLLSLPQSHFPPTFGELIIRNCPRLKQWCLKHRREYRSIISRIPSVEIDDERNTRIRDGAIFRTSSTSDDGRLRWD